MKRSVLFVLLTFLLVFTSVLAPCPDFLSKVGNFSGGGLQVASAADLSAVTVGTSTNIYAIGNGGFHRCLIYAASRFWLFYNSDNNTAVYRSSLDGSTWSSPTTVGTAYHGYNISIWWDGTYIHYARGTSNIYYRRGVPNEDGTFSWSAAEQTVTTYAGSDWGQVTGICTDGSGHPILSYTHNDDSDGKTYPCVTKSSTTDGTWSTAADFPYDLSADNDTNWRTVALPLANDNFMIIYAKSSSSTIKSRSWNTAWGTENTTALSCPGSNLFSAVETSDHKVHMVFLQSATGDIQSTTWTQATGVWSAESAVYAGTSATMAPVLSKTLDDNLYCFWMGDTATDNIYYKAQTTGTWDASATTWQDETDITDNASISCAYEQTTTNYIPVVWLTGAGSPYNVRFAALELGGSPWLEGWDYRQEIPITGSSGAGSDYLFEVTVSRDGQYLASGNWTVNSKEYDYRIPFVITEENNTALTGYQVRVPVNTNWLKSHQYLDDACNGDEFEITYENGTVVNYWTDPVYFQNWADVWVKVDLTASQTLQMYLYFDPDITSASSNFSVANTMYYYSAKVAASADDTGVYYLGGWQITNTSNFYGYGYYNSYGVQYGARWTNVTIPKDALIMDAYLKLQANGAQAGGVYPDANAMFGYLVGEDYDNVTNYAGETAAGFNARTKTTAINEFNSALAIVDNYIWRVHCQDIVKEITSRAGWVSGNALAIDGYRSLGISTRYAHSYDADPSVCEELNILARQYSPLEPSVSISFSYASTNGDCTDFPNDITFTGVDGLVELSYWQNQEQSDQDTAEFWVQVAASLDSDQVIYMYYGKAGQASQSDDTIWDFYQDFSGESENVTNPTGFTTETGTWETKEEFLSQDQYSADGEYNNQGAIATDGESYYMFTCSQIANGYQLFGITVKKSDDKINWTVYKNINLPDGITAQWDVSIYQEGGVTYIVSGGSALVERFVGTTDGSGGQYTYECYYWTTTDFENYVFGGRIMNSTEAAYTYFLTKFSSTYYLYYASGGSVYCENSTTVSGPYANQVLIEASAHALETPSVYYQSSDNTYYLFVTQFVGVGGLAADQDMRYFTCATPAGTFGTETVVTFNTTAPKWMESQFFGGRLFYSSSDSFWYLYMCGREHLGHACAVSREAGTGYATKAALGAGTWTVESKMNYRVTSVTATPLGTSTVGTTAIPAGRISFSKFAASSNTTLYYIFIYDSVGQNLGDPLYGVAQHAKVAIYSDNGSGEPASLLGKSVSTHVVWGWNIIPLDTAVTIVSGTNYWIGSNRDTAGTTVAKYAAGSMRWMADAYANAFPASWNTATDTHAADFYDTVQAWGLSSAVTTTDEDATDVAIYTRVRGVTGSTRSGIRWRCTDNNDSYYYLYVDASNDSLNLGYRKSAGLEVALSSTAISFAIGTPAERVYKELVVKNDSTRIQVWVNDLLLIDTTDDNITASGKVKLFSVGDDYGYFKYLRVRPCVLNEPHFAYGESGAPTSIAIEVDPVTWTEFYQEGSSSHVHLLRGSSWYTSDNDTNKDYYTLTNTGGSTIDCLISSGDNWTGTGVVWHVSPTGDPGDHTIGLWCGLDSDSGYVILVKPDDPANFLLTALAASAHDHFGLKVYTCTSNGGNASMSGTITLTAVVHT